jgi:predicted nucleic acid-binding protein
MIVVDSSIVVDLLLQSNAAPIEQRLRNFRVWLAPELLDLEVGNVLRRLMLAKMVSRVRAEEALADYEVLPIQRCRHRPLLRRAWALSGRATLYDASYLALAKSIDATLLTRDRKLYNANHVTQPIEFV